MTPGWRQRRRDQARAWGGHATRCDTGGSAIVAMLWHSRTGWLSRAGLLNRLDGEVPAASAATGLGAVNVVEGPTEPGKAFDYSLDNQIRVGTELAKEALARSKRSRSRAIEAYLTRMVRRLAAADPRAPRFIYRVYLIDSPNPNAFNFGRRPYFRDHRSAARLRTEAQMAMVPARELAKNTQAHVSEGRSGCAISRRVVASASACSSRIRACPG